jgi:hypothetical protein
MGPLSFAKEIALQIDFAAAAIAFIALVISVRTWHQQSRLAVETLRMQRDNDIINWSNATIDIIAQIDVLLRAGGRMENKAFLDHRDDYIGQLSANIDKGRLYFPNVEHDTYGIEKESAYQGHRQPILDCLVAIYDAIKDLDVGDSERFANARREVIARKRAFVSEAQSAIEPRRRVLFLKSAGKA